MFKLFLILITILLIVYFIKGIVRLLLSFFNKNEVPPVVNSKKSKDKKKIPYDKSKVVDADFEDMK